MSVVDFIEIKESDANPKVFQELRQKNSEEISDLKGEICEAIRIRIRDYGVLQKEVALATGLRQSDISKIANGYTEKRSLITLLALSEHLGLKLKLAIVKADDEDEAVIVQVEDSDSELKAS